MQHLPEPVYDSCKINQLFSIYFFRLTFEFFDSCYCFNNFSLPSLSVVEKGCVESGFTGASNFIISANFFIDSGVLSSIFLSNVLVSIKITLTNSVITICKGYYHFRNLTQY